MVTEDGGTPTVVFIHLLDGGDEEPSSGGEWFEYRTAHKLLHSREEKNAAWSVVHVLLCVRSLSCLPLHL